MNDVAEVSDESLMLAYAAGDAAAFERLYQRHRGKLYRFLARQLHGNGALADELFQDVWQRVITARQSWKPEAAFSTWLYRIAHNRLADHWRALQHRPPAPDDADERTERMPDHDTPERQLSAFEERRRLQLALDELPEEQREVINLLGQAERGDGVSIFIGSENKLFSLSGSSLIIAPFTDEQRKVVGVLGVIGPKRLNYARIIPMIDYTAKLVGRLLT